MNLTHKHVQTGLVYGLPSKDTQPQMSEAQTFQFGFRHAYQNKPLAIYMGPHTEAFKAGCNHGQEARSLRLELAVAQLKVEDLTVQRDGLVRAIKALRAELEQARTAAGLFTKGTRVLGCYNGFTGVVEEDQKPGANVMVRWDRWKNHNSFACAPDGLKRI